ncbi:MAG TPA: EF-hand domain-containing protein [Pseudolabrys sp.]|nr:EF-hand domain-containing protein [Pseudolabrys sp.]
MLSTLISLQSQQTQQPSPLFSKLDSDGDGQISQSEFENAATKAGASKDMADAVFAKIDGDSDGSVSQSELTKADHGGGHHHHRVGGGGGGGASGQSALDALISGTGADGATTQSATNADGSTTTTISYADGSKVDMTTPAASGGDASGGGTSGNKSTSNLLEQLIKLQSQVLSVATSTMSAFA